jgi:hypothetical protein
MIANRWSLLVILKLEKENLNEKNENILWQHYNLLAYLLKPPCSHYQSRDTISLNLEHTMYPVVVIISCEIFARAVHIF